jgi:glycosyltransferase involved in cell wall biosynthesis
LLVVNHHVLGGQHGEKVLWNGLTDHFGCPWIDLRDPGINLRSFGADVQRACEMVGYKPSYVIQNCTFMPIMFPDAKTVAYLQDNYIRMRADVPQQRQVARRATRTICNGSLIQQDYELADAPHSRIIHCPVDLAFWQEWAGGDAKRPTEKPFRGAFVGSSLSHVKGTSIFMEVAERTQYQILWAVFLKDKAIDHEPFIDLFAQVPQTVLRDYHHISNVLVVLSPVETQCLAAIEALACGCPIVMFRTGFCHDLTEAEQAQVGEIIDTREPLAVSEVVERVAAQEWPDTRSVVERFDYPVIMKQWSELITELREE